MKNNYPLLLSATIAIVILLLLSSCGTRKTDKKYHEIKSNYSFNDSSYILTQNVRLNDVGELIPVDNTKPFLVDGKEYFNVSIKFDKSKFNDFELNQTYIGTVNGTSEISDNRQTEKTDDTLLYIGLFFVLCLFIFLWFYLKRTSIFNFRN